MRVGLARPPHLFASAAVILHSSSRHLLFGFHILSLSVTHTLSHTHTDRYFGYSQSLSVAYKVWCGLDFRALCTPDREDHLFEANKAQTADETTSGVELYFA